MTSMVKVVIAVGAAVILLGSQASFAADQTKKRDRTRDRSCQSLNVESSSEFLILARGGGGGGGAGGGGEREEALAVAVAVEPAATKGMVETLGQVLEIRDWEIITAMVPATARATAAPGPRMAPDMAKPPRSDALKDLSLWF